MILTLDEVEPGQMLEQRRITVPAVATVQPVCGIHVPRCVPLGGVALYLVDVVGRGGSPPTFTWEVYGRFGRADDQAELLSGASGTLSKFTTWRKRGGIVRVSGALYTGFELRACVSGAAELSVGFLWVTAEPTSSAFAVSNGELV